MGSGRGRARVRQGPPRPAARVARAPVPSPLRRVRTAGGRRRRRRPRRRCRSRRAPPPPPPRRPAVVDAAAARGGGAGHGVRDIPLDAIVASLEPHRAAQFDSEFRPSGPTRRRWLSVWLAEDRGAVLPPISVAAIGDAYAIRDG